MREPSRTSPQPSQLGGDGVGADTSWMRAGFPAIATSLVVVLSYVPVVFVTFAFLDDYPFLAKAVRGESGTFELLASAGRPVTGWLIEAAFGAAGSIGGLRWIRLVTVIGTGAVGAYVTYLSVTWGWRKTEAVGLGVIVATLPSFQVYVSWAQYFVVPPAILLAMLGGRLALQVADAPTPRRRLLVGGSAGLLLLTSVLMYQPAAMMFLVVVLLSLVVDTQPIRRQAQRLAGAVAAAAPAFLAALVVASWLGSHYGPSSRSQPVSDIVGKARWFISDPLVRSLNGFLLSHSRAIAVVAAIVIATGLWLRFKGPTLHRVGMSAAALSIVPLSYLPNLVVAESFGSYRTQVALASVVAVLTVVSLREMIARIPRPGRSTRRWRVSSLWLIGLSAIASLSAARHVITDFALPQSIELRLVSSELERAGMPDDLLFVQPEMSESIASTQRFDEFGTPSTNRDYVPEPMVFLIRREHEVLGPFNIELVVVGSLSGAEEVPVIDLTRLGSFRLHGGW